MFSFDKWLIPIHLEVHWAMMVGYLHHVKDYRLYCHYQTGCGFKQNNTIL
jgi:Ulp1 family protease